MKNARCCQAFYIEGMTSTEVRDEKLAKFREELNQSGYRADLFPTGWWGYHGQYLLDEVRTLGQIIPAEITQEVRDSLDPATLDYVNQGGILWTCIHLDLTKEYPCMAYEDRPEMCRTFPNSKKPDIAVHNRTLCRECGSCYCDFHPLFEYAKEGL